MTGFMGLCSVAGMGLDYRQLQPFVEKYAKANEYITECTQTTHLNNGRRRIAKLLADRFPGTLARSWNRQLERWTKTGDIGANSADRICTLMELDPASIWGEDWCPKSQADDAWYTRWLAGEFDDEVRNSGDEGRELIRDRRSYAEQVA